MGKRNAQNLATRLNAEPNDSSKLIIFGCAGSLTSRFRAGDTFIISKIIQDSTQIEILSSSSKFKTTASLTTVSSIAATPDQKKLIAEQTGAELVDLEMAHLWNSANQNIRDRMIFVRSVIDHHDDNIEFLVNKWAWLKLTSYRHAFQFVHHFRTYLKSIEKFLQSLELNT